jgi:hypothetical protein
VLAALGQLDLAADSLHQAIDLEPLSATTFANLGVIETARGSHGAAIGAFERASQLLSANGGVPSGPAFLSRIGASPSNSGTTTSSSASPTVIDSNVDLGGGADPGHGRETPGTPAPAPGATVPPLPPAVLVTTLVTPGNGESPVVQYQARNGDNGEPISGLPSRNYSTFPGSTSDDETHGATAVPEPGSLFLLLSGGLAGSGAYWLRRRRRFSGR